MAQHRRLRPEAHTDEHAEGHAAGPYLSGDNPHTLLTASDLVFIDAPGTGYSRLIGDTTPAQVWGVDQDVDAFAKAITRWLTITNNWNAPRFLFGESYGTTRAASLVHRLQNQGLDFNGVVLLSTVLNWGENPRGPREYINLLPSFAATAWYHGKARTAHTALEPFLAEAREFAQGPFAAALLRGDLLPVEEEDAIAERMSALVGLDVDLLKKNHFRIGMEKYRYALLADEGRVIGRFDTRFTAEHQYVVGRIARPRDRRRRHRRRQQRTSVDLPHAPGRRHRLHERPALPAPAQHADLARLGLEAQGTGGRCAAARARCLARPLRRCAPQPQPAGS